MCFFNKSLSFLILGANIFKIEKTARLSKLRTERRPCQGFSITRTEIPV